MSLDNRWEKIDSAPLRTWLLVFVPGNGEVVARSTGYGWWLVNKGILVVSPTHWRPLEIGDRDGSYWRPFED